MYFYLFVGINFGENFHASWMSWIIGSFGYFCEGGNYICREASPFSVSWRVPKLSIFIQLRQIQMETTQSPLPHDARACKRQKRI
jgi:hypothetical protein